MAEYYLTGSTVRLKGTFRDYDGSLMAPELVTLTIYDDRWALQDTFSLTGTDRDNEGAYTFDYIFNKVGKYFYEFKGETAGSPVLDRKEIHIRRI